MKEVNENSNAQSWELEVVCKNRKYLNAIIGVILEQKCLNFKAVCVDMIANDDARYLVLVWGHWFGNLKNLTKQFAKIENRLE